MGINFLILKIQDSSINKHLLLACSALVFAGFGSFCIWHIQGFQQELETSSTLLAQQKSALHFAFPFIIISIFSVGIAILIGLKHQKKGVEVAQLLEECLLQLSPATTDKSASGNEKTHIQTPEEIVEETKTQMNQLAHIVTHDLRAPLRTINSFTTLLKRSLNDRLTERELAHMNFIVSDTLKLNHLLQDMGEFARIEQFLIQPREHSLTKVLEQAIILCSDEIESSNVIIDFPTELPNLFCDARKIKEIFVQIIRNAIRYSIPGSQPKLSISFTESEHFFEFDCTDYGIGIPEQSLQKIFLSFAQLKAVTNQKGIGIGLAISKKYVELHGGKIWCHSANNKTVFSFQVSKYLQEESEDLQEAEDLKLNLATTSI